MSISNWLRWSRNGLTCAAVTPVGPGHADRARECRASIEAAWRQHKGPFAQLFFCFVDDGYGQHGRSRARNIGARDALNKGADWLFFLDADDLMTSRAFEIFSNYAGSYDAVWGLLANKRQNTTDFHIRFPQAMTLESLDELLLLDPFLTLLMGHFIRTKAWATLPFNEALDAGEDFDYYIRAWEKYRCIKIAQVLSINRSDIKAGGPRPATADQWRATATELLAEALKRNGLERNSPRAIAALNRCAMEAQAFCRGRDLTDLGSPLSLSKRLPYRGFVDVDNHSGEKFVLFENNDDPICASIAWTGDFEGLSSAIWQALARSSKVILDIGAYNGYFGFLAASVAPHAAVHCFEPLERNMERLRFNISVNEFKNVRAADAVIANGAEIVEFSARANDKGGANRKNTGSKASPSGSDQSMVCTRIDEYAKRHGIDSVDLVRISVEGAEIAVLVGMQQVLAKCRPNLLIKLVRDQTQTELSTLLRQNGYSFYSICDSRQEVSAAGDLIHDGANEDLNWLATVHEASEVAELVKQAYGRPSNFG